MINDINLPTIFNPQTSHNDVVHCEWNLSPGVVIASLAEDQVAHTVNLDLKVTTAEFGGD